MTPQQRREHDAAQLAAKKAAKEAAKAAEASASPAQGAQVKKK